MNFSGMTPRSFEYRMPPEWAPHVRTWMLWPCREEIWPNGINAARRAYAALARTISCFEPVFVMAKPENVAEAKELCGEAVKVVSFPIDDSWSRDTGATFLVNNNLERVAVSWLFNGYGEKFRPYDQDNRVAEEMARISAIPCFSAPFVMEGGSFHVDGEGTALVTEQSVLNGNRNSHVTKKEFTEVCRECLGVEKVIFLPYGLSSDLDTDGHVDNVASFTKPGEVALLWTEDCGDSHYPEIKENHRALQMERDAHGRRINIVKIPQPKERYRPENAAQRLPDSTLQYVLVNGGLIYPTFGDPVADQQTGQILGKLFPDRRIVPLDGRDIVLGGGGFHCITQQEPASLPVRGGMERNRVFRRFFVIPKPRS